MQQQKNDAAKMRAEKTQLMNLVAHSRGNCENLQPLPSCRVQPEYVQLRSRCDRILAERLL